MLHLFRNRQPASTCTAETAGNQESDQEAPSSARQERDDPVESGPSSGPNAEKTRPADTKNRLVRPGAALVAILPCIALLLTLGAGWLKWHDATIRGGQSAATDTVKAATDGTVAILSYRPDTVDEALHTARERLTGNFRDAYTSLVDDVVIPGAKQKQISAIATVPAAASVSATDDHAVVLVFVNQSTIVGTDAPTETASSVRVTLDKIDGRWLISEFTPI